MKVVLLGFSFFYVFKAIYHARRDSPGLKQRPELEWMVEKRKKWALVLV
jgi:hypothetical protein